MFEYIIEFRAMKGLGPEMVAVNIPVGFDDVDPDVPEYIVREWAINDAKSQMREKGFERFTLVEIHVA